ncbi:putative allantoate permease [Patellaria atrata CBS 101060]|uniref:Allantoate permease n=1 Tax=Patellaria atrata CBS 101060 TaxID=1346257 RepID=A0A9P4SBS4_9PEZI|nr:putative allantoate permease [Patellaria atrata CBS 101060]
MMEKEKETNISALGSSSSSQDADIISGIDEAKLLRRIDFRVLPMLFTIYVVAFLDRVNVSNALTMKMPEELGMTGQQPNIALTIFFIPYIIFEIPSNILMKKLNPHIWLSLCILGFGIIMIGQGFVKTVGGLYATRFFLGLLEAGIFPGSFYLISFWYKREEAQKRFTVYWSSVMAAGAFGGLLATAIAKMDGMLGHSNWRWIFILEGILTVLVGIAAFFLVSDFPREAKWLTEEERRFVMAKTHTDESHQVSVKFKDIIEFFKDPKQYLGGLMYFSIVTPVYAFSFFTPTIVRTLGYSVVQTQLHSVPPFAAALVLCLIMAYISDKINLRLPFILFGYALLIVGLAILLCIHHKFSPQYGGIHLVLMGSLGAGASIVCWYLMNLKGHKQRSIGSGFMISFGNTGGILAPFTFLKKDAPNYETGYSICMAMAVLGIASSVTYGVLVWREKKAARRNGDEDAEFLSL